MSRMGGGPATNVRFPLTKALGALHEAIWAAFEPRLAEIGLSMTDFQLLSAVHSARGSATQIQIAASLGITAPSLSEAVRGLERESLVERHMTAADRRVRILRLTPAGETLLISAFEMLAGIEQTMTAGLRPHDLEIAELTMKRMLDGIEASDLLKVR